jgi:hypothetical protein
MPNLSPISYAFCLASELTFLLGQDLDQARARRCRFQVPKSSVLQTEQGLVVTIRVVPHYPSAFNGYLSYGLDEIEDFGLSALVLDNLRDPGRRPGLGRVRQQGSDSEDGFVRQAEQGLVVTSCTSFFVSLQRLSFVRV